MLCLPVALDPQCLNDLQLLRRSLQLFWQPVLDVLIYTNRIIPLRKMNRRLQLGLEG